MATTIIMGICCSDSRNVEAGRPLLTHHERDRSEMYIEGDIVTVLQPGTERWCKATIVGVRGDHTYDILYDDGDEDAGIPWDRIMGGKKLRKHETSQDARMRRMDPRTMHAFDANNDIDINIRDIGEAGDGQGADTYDNAHVDAQADTRARLRQASNLRTAGAVAHRQLVVTAPMGSNPGNQMVIATPSGVKMKVVIPPGVAPGESFHVNVQVVPGGAAGAGDQPRPPTPPTHKSLPTSSSAVQRKLQPPHMRAARARTPPHGAIEEGDSNSSPSHSLDRASRSQSRESSMDSVPAMDIAKAAMAWRDSQSPGHARESSGSLRGSGPQGSRTAGRSEHSLDRDWRRQWAAEEQEEERAAAAEGYAIGQHARQECAENTFSWIERTLHCTASTIGPDPHSC